MENVAIVVDASRIRDHVGREWWGAMYVQSATRLAVIGSTISDSWAAYGGGICGNENVTTRIEDSIIERASAVNYDPENFAEGGGIFVSGRGFISLEGTTTIRDCFPLNVGEHSHRSTEEVSQRGTDTGVLIDDDALIVGCWAEWGGGLLLSACAVCMRSRARILQSLQMCFWAGIIKPSCTLRYLQLLC